MTTHDVIAETINNEAARNEKVIAWLRLGLAFAILPDIVGPEMVPVVLWFDVACLAYCVTALAATYRWAGWPGFKYVIMTVDAAVMVYLTIANPDAVEPTVNFLLLALCACLLVVTASIRMSQWAVAYATGLMMVISAAVLWWQPVPAVAAVGAIVVVLLLGCLSYFVMMRLLDLLVEVTRKEQLSRFLSPELVEQAMHDPALLQLGGKRQSVTVLFVDIRKFSAKAETHTPEEVVGFLNDYFRVLTDVIFRHRGTLDKFMGDALMALFGAPLGHPDDADRAVRAAVEMMEEVVKLNAEKVRGGFCPIEIGIGINTAEVIAGNVGADRRMEYTVIGDGVNVAARLEKLTKRFDTKIIISQATHERLTDRLAAISYGETTVEGRTQMIRIYGVPHAGMRTAQDAAPRLH